MVDLVDAGVLIILVGAVLIVLTAVLSSRARDGGEERQAGLRGGGVIMIGPVPIIIGSDAKWASIAVVLAIILVVVSFFFMRYAV